MENNGKVFDWDPGFPKRIKTKIIRCQNAKSTIFFHFQSYTLISSRWTTCTYRSYELNVQGHECDQEQSETTHEARKTRLIQKPVDRLNHNFSTKKLTFVGAGVCLITLTATQGHSLILAAFKRPFLTLNLLLYFPRSAGPLLE